MLNQSAARLFDDLVHNASRHRVAVSTVAGATVVDASAGGLDAGLMLARLCLADHADVSIVPGDSGPAVQVRTDHPVFACLASQYAGWQIGVGKYFAMGSGPMRAIAAREAIFEHLPGKETSTVAVGVLETKKLPPEEVVRHLQEKLPGAELKLAVAPCASLPGTLQVVARSVETALHKLHELKFDVATITSGHGVAPLPPVAASEMAAVGRTNDAILYGARVTLWGRFDDAVIDAIGPKVPSSASKDYGKPFAELFEQYGGDFYKIDPLLFAPAQVTFANLATGRQVTFGAVK
jgi:methenyltetrahydromethanopterin cyclohydrolase